MVRKRPGGKGHLWGQSTCARGSYEFKERQRSAQVRRQNLYEFTLTEATQLYSGFMRRWLLTFLLVLLPLQFVWGAAAPYCKHEESPAVQHVGHHEHRHGELKAVTSVADDRTALGSEDLSGSLDNDCGYCQHSASKPVFFVVSKVVDVTRSRVQAPPDAAVRLRDPYHIDRPNWPRPARVGALG